MKQSISTKIISVMLAIIMAVISLPLTAFAAETGATNSGTTSTPTQTKKSVEEALKKEMADRAPVTKDRSAGADSLYAVYVDGALYKKSTDFSEVWNLAMSLAPYAVEDDTHKNNGNNKNVEFVLYHDINYISSWFGEGTMTISNKKFTIDLNGHVLRRFNDNGTVIKVTNNSILTIMDSNPTRINAGNIVKNNIWQPLQGGSTKIAGGVIAGGYLKTSAGGGIHISGKSTVYMTGGTIAGNKADIGSAVYLEGNSVIDMSVGNSQICYNYCAGTSSDGGAIFLRSDCSVIGGYVHNNLADDYGGGIRAKGNNILIQDVVVYGNTALDYGGGLYLENNGSDQSLIIYGCRVIGNTTADGGGGIYIYDLMMTYMSDCVVEYNMSASSGGGVCLGDYSSAGLTLSGQVIIRNNTENKDKVEKQSNLYLEGSDDLVVDSLSIGSEVHVRTKKAASSYNGYKNSFLAKKTSASYLYFFADEPGYTVKYQIDPAKEKYHFMYFEKGTRAETSGVTYLTDYTTKQIDDYTVETGANAGKTSPLYKGYFEFNLMTTSEFYSASPFYYSDGYFFEDPTFYNSHLATMSINLAVAAFGRSTTDVGDNAYANHAANVKQLLADIGCDDSKIYISQDYQMKPTYYGKDGERLSTIGVAISQKEITVGEETYTLVPIAIRGGSYEIEWASNVTIGNNGEAQGFSDAANQVYTQVQDYLYNYGLAGKAVEGKVKFWVVGYSRAGATANITSKKLVDYYAEKGNQVYGYTFEAPMGGVESEAVNKEYTGNGKYPTIHNTINENDFVTLVAPSEMGFIRYGVDHLVGSDYNNGNPVSTNVNSKYYEQRMKMVSQLAAINPYYTFEDSWLIGDINLVKGNLPLGTPLIDTRNQNDPGVNKECKNIYEFLRWFFLKVQQDGLNLPNGDVSKSREYYSTYKPLANIAGNNKTNVAYSSKDYNFGYSTMSVQKAVEGLMTLVMGSLTDEQMNALMTILIRNAMEIKDDIKSIRWWTLVFLPLGLIAPVIATVWIDIDEFLSLVDDLVKDWYKHTEKQKAESINSILHRLLDKHPEDSIWNVLTAEQADVIAEAVPVLMWFLLNYASMDYRTDEDSGMWGLGTFIANASTIISNHYQEVSVAWVRSYDSYYENDLQAYRLDTSKIVAESPEGKYATGNKSLAFVSQPGSSVFYSTDNGETWKLYTSLVVFKAKPEKILCFSIYRGVKSPVVEVSLTGWSGTLLGNGSVWFLVGGAAIIIAAGAVVVAMNRKKKKATEGTEEIQ